MSIELIIEIKMLFADNSIIYNLKLPNMDGQTESNDTL